MGATPILAAALAGIPAAIQRQGLWTGTRQLFIRFSGPAETAQMYTADALARELNRGLTRSVFYAVGISGRDAFGNTDFLAAALRQLPPGTRVIADTDGQRPEAIARLHEFLSAVQVTIELPAAPVMVENACKTLQAARAVNLQHAVVIVGADESSDADYLQIVDQTHSASPEASVVIHPGPSAERGPLDRRWSVLVEHAMSKHADVRIALRLAGPATTR